MRNDSGFTFFEMMTVIGIFALVFSIALPNIIGWLPNYRMSSAADDLVSVFWRAQKRALRENANVVVRFNFVNDSYLAFVDNGVGANAGNGIQDAGETTVTTGQMHPGIDLQDGAIPNDLGALVQFNRRGFPDVSGNIVVTNGGGTRIVTLTLAGSSSIQW